MKLLNKENLNIIVEKKLITEKAVHWNQSVIGLLVDTILTPFSWLKNLSAPTVGQVEVLAMQWGAEYSSAIIDVLNDNEVSIPDEDELTDTDEDNTLIYEEEIYDSIKKYSDSLKQLITDLGEIYKNSDTDIYVLHEQIKKLNMDDIILSKEFKQFIEFVYTDNKVHYEKVITATPYDAIIKPHIDKIEEITKNIVNKATEDDYKDKEFISNFIVEITELDTNITKLNEDIKTESLEILKTQEENANKAAAGSLANAATGTVPGSQQPATSNPTQVNTSFNNFLKNNINLNSTISSNYPSIVEAKAELPDDIKDLMSQEMLEKAKAIKNIKQFTAKKLNYASLNTIRYQANYLINKSEKNKDKLQHAFDSNILDVNNYFQDVIDTKNVMAKATGSVDADTEKAVGEAQDSLNEITGLKIEEVKKDSKFKVGDVYAFQVALTSSANKLINAILFLSPINAQYNDKMGNEEVFLLRYLGAYKFDKKDNKITSWNPFENVILPTELRTGLSSDKIIIDTLLLTGMRPAKTYYGIMGIASGKKKMKTNSFFYDKSVISSDDIIKTDIVNLKEKVFTKTLDNIRSKNTSFKIKIIQRYDVNMDEIKAGTYENLSEDILNINTMKNKNVIDDFTKLVNAIV